jgi:hypothetical protein
MTCTGNVHGGRPCGSGSPLNFSYYRLSIVSIRLMCEIRSHLNREILDQLCHRLNVFCLGSLPPLLCLYTANVRNQEPPQPGDSRPVMPPCQRVLSEQADYDKLANLEYKHSKV